MQKEKRQNQNGPNVLHVVVRDKMVRTLPPPVVYLWVTCSLSLGHHSSTISPVFSLTSHLLFTKMFICKTQALLAEKRYYYERLKTWHWTTDVKNNEQISQAIQKFKTTGKALKPLLGRQHRKQNGLRQNLSNKDQKSLSLPFSNFSVP